MTSLGRRMVWSFGAVLLLGVLPAVMPVSALAESANSTWECLPEETVVALRFPDGKAMADEILRSKFGAVMFSEQRKAAVLKALEQHGSEEWSKFQNQLEAYDLEMGDLLQLFAGESGYAVVMNADQVDEDQAPLFYGIGWLEPGEELAEKMQQIIARLVEEQDDAEHPVTRVDLTLADQSVMQLRVPSVSVEHDNDAYDLGDDYDELSEEEQEAAWRQATKKWEESAVEAVSYRTVLVCQLGGRLLLAHVFQASDEGELADAAEQLSQVFGQLLAAHESGEGGFVSRLASDSGVTRVMGQEGLSTFELLGDVAPLIDLFQEFVPDGKGEIVIRLLGLDNLGPVAGKSTIVDSQTNTQFSLALPAPRQGLMRLLDQEALAIDPPAWVPASAIRYYQVSYDLGEAYTIVKEEVLREFPDQASNGFQMAEAYTQGFAQASLPEVLSSLGNRHTFLSFGTDTSSNTEIEVGRFSERLAIVWQVDDEQLWSRLLKGMTPFSQMAGGLEFSEEQGFSGWRMKKGNIEGGLFLGKGYLVLAVGSGVLESMLSSLNSPATGEDSLRGSPVFAKAREMMDLEPGILAEITDGDRYMSMSFSSMKKQLLQLAKLMGRSSDEEGSLLQALVKAIIPSEAEMKGMTGVIASRWEANEEGIFMENAQEVPRE